MGSSLLSGSEYDDIGVKGGGGKKGGGGNGDTIKLVGAVTILVVAGALLAYNFGLLDFGGSKAPEPTQAERDAFNEQKAKSEEIMLRKDVTEAGS